MTFSSLKFLTKCIFLKYLKFVKNILKKNHVGVQQKNAILCEKCKEMQLS